MVAAYKIACMSLDAMMRIVRSTAYSEALLGGMHREFRPYTESFWVWAMTNAISHHDPGWWEITQDDRFIAMKTANLEKKYADKLMVALSRGSDAAIDYLDSLVNERAKNMAAIQMKFRMAQMRNENALREAQNTLIGLSAVRLAATLVVTAIPAGAGLILGPAGLMLGVPLSQIGLVTLGYSVVSAGAKTVVLADDLQSAKGAAAVAVTTEIGKDMTVRATDKLEKMGEFFGSEYAYKLELFGRRIYQHSKDLAGALTEGRRSQVLNGLDRANEGYAATEAAMERAEGAALLGKVATRALPVVFAGMDVYDDIQNFRGN